MNELCTRGAAELATMIRSRQVTSTEVVDAHLARIEEVNPDINALTVTLAAEARAAAVAIDRAVEAGAPLGPLAGVPFTVKENIDVAGSATTWGVPALLGQIATADAPVVARLRAAGAIPMARTNLPDFAFRWHTESSRAGHTRNPWDPSRTPGGSSGGEAVALATGMTPLGLGNDLGGSLRIPSQMCGIAALRPTNGRIADAAATEPGVPPISIQLLNCQGPMARRVADLRLALGVLSGPDARDPRWVPAPLQGPRIDGPIRVAVVRDPLGVGIDAHVRAGIDRAADWLAEAGYDLVDVEPPHIGEVTATWFDMVGADFGGMWQLMEPIAGPGLHEFVARCVSLGVMKEVNQAQQAAALMARHRLGAAWARFSEEYPIVLAPVCCERPWLVGDDIQRVDEVGRAMRMVLPVNVLGLPSCAVPVGSDDTLPQGVQLIGARFREDLILDAAQAVEDRAPSLTPMQPRVQSQLAVGVQSRG
jgi:amidase